MKYQIQLAKTLTLYALVEIEAPTRAKAIYGAHTYVRDNPDAWCDATEGKPRASMVKELAK